MWGKWYRKRHNGHSRVLICRNCRGFRGTREVRAGSRIRFACAQAIEDQGQANPQGDQRQEPHKGDQHPNPTRGGHRSAWCYGCWLHCEILFGRGRPIRCGGSRVVGPVGWRLIRRHRPTTDGFQRFRFVVQAERGQVRPFHSALAGPRRFDERFLPFGRYGLIQIVSSASANASAEEYRLAGFFCSAFRQSASTRGSMPERITDGGGGASA